MGRLWVVVGEPERKRQLERNRLDGGKNKKRVNFTLQHAMKTRGEGQRYITTLSLTSALYGVGWSRPRSSHFTPKKGVGYPFYKKLGGPLSIFGRVRKISPPPKFEPKLSGHYRFSVRSTIFRPP
jgi:hypothetical protein